MASFTLFENLISLFLKSGEEHFQELLEENGELDNLELNGEISENEENLDNDDESNDATWVADALEKYEAGEGDKPKIKMKKRSGPFGKYNMPIKCDLCDTYYAGKRRLKEHMERKHEKYFKCKKCGESCFGIENLRKHREEVHQQAPKKQRGRKPGDKLTEVVCDTCGKSFTGTKKLQVRSYL